MSLRNKNWPAKRQPDPDTFKGFPLELMSGPEREYYYQTCWPPLPEQMIEDIEDELERDSNGA